VHGSKRGLAVLSQHVLEPRSVLVVAITRAVEQPDHGLTSVEHFYHGEKLVERYGILRRGRQTPSRDHLEPAFAVACPGDQPDVIDRTEGNILGRGGQRDLELPG